MPRYVTENKQRSRAVRDALDKLAAEGSPDQIAALLLRQGIRGTHSLDADVAADTTCPVSRYVQAVTGLQVPVNYADDDNRVKVGSVWAPPVVAQFVDRYDSLDYRELIEASNEAAEPTVESDPAQMTLPIGGAS